MENNLLGLASVFYVSKITVSATQVEAIARGARANNKVLNLTGGLIFTGQYFAQILEGPTDVLNAKMLSIYADPRHDTITPIWYKPIHSRTYLQWSMGFVLAPSVDRIGSALVAEPGNAHAAEQLSAMILDLVSSRSPQS